MSAHYLGRSSAASVITRSCLLGEKPGTDGTFTNFHSPKNWETFRLSPVFLSAVNLLMQ